MRGKSLQALRAAQASGTLSRNPACTVPLRQRRAQTLLKRDWVVYAKTPLAGPAAVLDYLSRYTPRTAIGNERLVAIDGERVLLRVRVNEKDSGSRTASVDGAEFVRRLLQHVLPLGFKRIRHYGLLSPASKAKRLAQAKRLLAMSAANPQVREDVRAFMRRVAGMEIDRCSHCSLGRWQLVHALPLDRGVLIAPRDVRRAAVRHEPSCRPSDSEKLDDSTSTGGVSLGQRHCGTCQVASSRASDPYMAVGRRTWHRVGV